jgi:N-methylhydantoinase A
MLSTIGLLLSDLRFDGVRSMPCIMEQADLPLVAATLAEMAEEGRRRIADEDLDVDIEVTLALDMRYRRQNWEIEIPVRPGALSAEAVAAAFDREHERLFGFNAPGQPHEIINLRCVAIGRIRDKATLLSRLVPAFPDTPGAPIGRRPLHDEALRRTVEAPIYERDDLARGQVIRGAALIVEPDSTIYVPGDATATIDEWGNIAIRFGAPPS